MVDIVTRLGKGSPLTNAEVDANFTNLAEVSGVTGEPMGHEDRTTSTISFNASTRTFTIAPVASSFTVWCKGKKVVVSTAQTVTIPNTTGMYSIYYDANGVLSAKSGYFTFSLEAPTAYVYWNAATGTAPYFGDERHGVVLDWQTHEYLHRTRGAALASGFSASGYVLGGNGSSNSHAQITLEGGTFFDEDMKIIVTATNTPTAGTWEQDLLSPARIPVLYLSGTAWVIDTPTDYPLKQGTARPQYNAYSGGVWSTADVANNKYSTSWILATNNLTYPVIAIIGQAQNDSQSAAEAVDFTELQLPGFPSVEFRPLYKLIFQCADSCTNAVHASLVSITDIRSIAAAGTAASIVTDHGNLSGLSDDDHPQYIHVDTLRTVSAAVKASFLPSQTSNAGKFLQTDGAATSWQALTSGNVTTALGFTPYNATNPSGYISGITSGMVTTALGFTPYNATNPSGYVTAAGARGAISVTGAGSYDSATGVINIVGGVTSFNTRTGAITLSSADVTTALGFTPYNNTNPSGYITGITSTMVTTALGFTPYNSSNPNGYISSITSANVTTALGFTPYNATNPSGYITSSALSGYLTSASAASTYLPLSGGTMTGTLGLAGTATNGFYAGTGDGASFSTYNFLLRGWNGMAFENPTSGGAYPNQVSGVVDFRNGIINMKGGFQTNGSTVLHAGNYSSYALPLSGGNMTGRIYNAAAASGLTYNAPFFVRDNEATGSNNSFSGIAFASSPGADYVIGKYSNGGTGLLQIRNHLGTGIWVMSQDGTTTHSGEQYIPILTVGGLGRSASNTIGANLGSGAISWNNAQLEIKNSDAGSVGIAFHRAGYTSNAIYANDANGLRLDGNIIVHAGNYNSYSPTLTGGGASGTWGINVTGNAGSLTATTAAGIQSSYSTTINTTTPGLANYGIVFSGHNTSDNAAGITWAWSGTNAQAGIYVQSSGAYGTKMYLATTDSFATGAKTAVSIDHVGAVNIIRGALTQAGNQVLHAGNYSSYAPTLTGGGASGTWNIKSRSINAVRTTNSNFNDLSTAVDTFTAGTNYIPSGGAYNQPADGDHHYLAWGGIEGSAVWAAQIDVNFYDDRVWFRRQSSSTWQAWRQFIHDGNFSSYALPLSGGTVTGPVTIDRSSGGAEQYIGLTVKNTTTSSGIKFQSSSRTYEIQSGSDGTFLVYDRSAEAYRFTISSSGTLFQGNLANAILHAGNYTSYSPSLGGSGASGTWGINVTGSAGSAGWSTYSQIIDTRAGQYSPNTYQDYRTTYEFTNQIVGGDWHTAMTMQGWHDGYSAWQIIGPASTSAHENWYLRSGVNTSWNSLRTILHSGNYNSYSPTLTGGNASGTWGISITGTASGNIPRSGSWLGDLASYGYTREHGISMTGGSEFVILSKNGQGSTLVDGSYFAYEGGGFYSSSNSAGNTLLGFYANGTGSLTFNTTAVQLNGNQILHAGNYTSYSPGSGSTWTFGDIYANNWFRNNSSNTGIYNQATGQHWYSDDTAYWNMGGNNGGQGIRCRDTHGSTVRGYLYYDTGNNIGFLNNSGNWRLRVVGGDYTLSEGSSMRAPVFYDSNDTGYYADPASTSNFNRLNVAGYQTGCSTTIDLTGYNQSTYYPVGISLSASQTTKIKINVGLNSSSNPSWSTHPAGFSLVMDWENNGGGWGTTNQQRRINSFTYGWANVNPCGGITQNNQASMEFVYLRGGARYHVQVSGLDTSISLYPSGYSYGGTTDNPTTSIINDVWSSANGNGISASTMRASTLTASSNAYSPIYYDSNDTTYYIDPNDTGTSVRVAGNITAYFSDMRLKTHLGKIENPREKLRQLEGFYYEANELAQSFGYKPKREVGVSAQAVQAVLPEIVTDAPVNSNYLTIDYERLTPLLIEAVKEQDAEILTLLDRLTKLEALVSKLIES